MSDDKIKKIRTWHVHYPPSRNAAPSLIAAYQDIATLLAEVDRLRVEIERLRAALGGIRIDGPDADGLVWATIQHPAIAVRSHVMVGNVNRMVSQAFMGFEEMRRKALEGKP